MLFKKSEFEKNPSSIQDEKFRKRLHQLWNKVQPRSNPQSAVNGSSIATSKSETTVTQAVSIANSISNSVPILQASDPQQTDPTASAVPIQIQPGIAGFHQLWSKGIFTIICCSNFYFSFHAQPHRVIETHERFT